MSYPDNEYYESLSQYDEAVEGFKEELRNAVKQEIRAEIDGLRKANGDMREKLKGLETLENEARDAKRRYEMKLGQAEHEARRTVEKEGLRKLLTVLAESRFKLAPAYSELPKCELCDDDRRLHYKTPRGKDAFDPCECAAKTRYYAVEESLVHEVAKRNGKILAWYSGVNRYFGDDDSFGSPAVLKSPDGVSLDDLMKHPHDYGFTAPDDAQKVADALNEVAE